MAIAQFNGQGTRALHVAKYLVLNERKPRTKFARLFLQSKKCSAEKGIVFSRLSSPPATLCSTNGGFICWGSDFGQRERERESKELVMASQNVLSLLRRKGLRSSSAIRNVNICGGGTSLCKSTLLLPWMQNTQHFRTLNHLTGSLQSGNPLKVPAYVEGNSPSRKLFRDLVLRPRQTPKFHKVIKGEAAVRCLIRPAAASVRGSLVCLAFLQDGEASVLTSGTVVRSDGIVATSTDCLRHLKGTKYKIGVNILGHPGKYKGVLLHTDFLSKIAFVKILCRQQLQVPECGNLDSVQEGDEVVAAGCARAYSNWTNTPPAYSLGLFSSIDDDVGKAVSHNARTSGRVIKASFPIGKHFTGGALVSQYGGVLGVIRRIRVSETVSETQATPIEDVLKYLEYFEKQGEHAKDMEGA